MSTMNSETKLSIIIPAYNVEADILETLFKVKKVFNDILGSYEIIIVNDGSLDNTLQILEQQVRSDDKIKIVSYKKNMGKGYAIKRGVLQSRGQTIIFLDGDGEIFPATIRDYLSKLTDYDIVIGSKKHPLSEVYGVPYFRKALSAAFHIVVRAFTDVKVKDTQCGIKIGNGSALRLIFKTTFVNRYAFDVEFLAIANIMNLKIIEMPVRYEYSKNGLKFKDVASMFKDVLAISYRYKLKHEYQKQLVFHKIQQELPIPQSSIGESI